MAVALVSNVNNQGTDDAGAFSKNLSHSTRTQPLTQAEYDDLMLLADYPDELTIDNAMVHLTNADNFKAGPHIKVGAAGGKLKHVRVEPGVGLGTHIPD